MSSIEEYSQRLINADLRVQFDAFNVIGGEGLCTLQAGGSVAYSAGLVSEGPGNWRVAAADPDAGDEPGACMLELTQPLTSLYQELYEVEDGVVFWRGKLNLVSGGDELYGFKSYEKAFQLIEAVKGDDYNAIKQANDQSADPAASFAPAAAAAAAGAEGAVQERVVVTGGQMISERSKLFGVVPSPFKQFVAEGTFRATQALPGEPLPQAASLVLTAAPDGATATADPAPARTALQSELQSILGEDEEEDEVNPAELAAVIKARRKRKRVSPNTGKGMGSEN